MLQKITRTPQIDAVTDLTRIEKVGETAEEQERYTKSDLVM